MLQQHLILGVLWLVFCVLHSVLAHSRIKKMIADRVPRFYKNYRFFYTLFAFASLGGVLYYQWQLSSPILFTPTWTTTLLGWAVILAGGTIMLICIKKYFLSLSGLKNLVAEELVANELRINGIHKYVRHPLYLGTFIFIWGLFFVYPYLSLLIANSIITLYTRIAIRFEEEKLIEEFGVAYLRYKEQVPMLLPHWKRTDAYKSFP